MQWACQSGVFSASGFLADSYAEPQRLTSKEGCPRERTGEARTKAQIVPVPVPVGVASINIPSRAKRGSLRARFFRERERERVRVRPCWTVADLSTSFSFWRAALARRRAFLRANREPLGTGPSPLCSRRRPSFSATALRFSRGPRTRGRPT